jgi:hypothetical protein
MANLIARETQIRIAGIARVGQTVRLQIGKDLFPRTV